MQQASDKRKERVAARAEPTASDALVPMDATTEAPPQPAIAPIATEGVPTQEGEWTGGATVPTAPTPAPAEAPAAPTTAAGGLNWEKITQQLAKFAGQMNTTADNRGRPIEHRIANDAGTGKLYAGMIQALNAPTQGRMVQPPWRAKLQNIFGQIQSEHGSEGLKDVLYKTFGGGMMSASGNEGSE